MDLSAWTNWEAYFGSWALFSAVCAGLVVIVVLRRVLIRVLTLRATAIAPSASRILSRLVKPVDYTEEGFFCVDGAPSHLVAKRKLGFKRLADQLKAGFSESAQWGDKIRDSFSDL